MNLIIHISIRRDEFFIKNDKGARGNIFSASPLYHNSEISSSIAKVFICDIQT